MFSKLIVTVLVAAFMAELAQGCSPTPSSGGSTAAGGSSAGASSASSAATTTTKPARRKREASPDGARIVLSTDTEIKKVGNVLLKLKRAAASLDSDGRKYGHIEHEVSVGRDGLAIITLHLKHTSDCAEVRQKTQKIVKKVSEVSN